MGSPEAGTLLAGYIFSVFLRLHIIIIIIVVVVIIIIIRCLLA